MQVPRFRLRGVLTLALAFAPWPMIYWLGYRAGYAAKIPERWAIARPTRAPNGGVAGASYEWYDINDPTELRRMREEERRLEAAGIEYYVAPGKVQTTTSVEPDPWRNTAPPAPPSGPGVTATPPALRDP